MDATNIYHIINYNNNNFNQYRVIIRLLYINISLAYIFDTSILSSVTRKMVNKLWQTICNLIETYKFVLDMTVGLHQQGLYNNYNNISSVY